MISYSCLSYSAKAFIVPGSLLQPLRNWSALMRPTLSCKKKNECYSSKYYEIGKVSSIFVVVGV